MGVHHNMVNEANADAAVPDKTNRRKEAPNHYLCGGKCETTLHVVMRMHPLAANLKNVLERRLKVTINAKKVVVQVFTTAKIIALEDDCMPMQEITEKHDEN